MNRKNGNPLKYGSKGLSWSPSVRNKLPARTADPEEAMEKKALVRKIKEAVDRLPVKQRSVFVLCQEQEFRYEEAADILKVPVGTVKSRMYKAVRLLRLQLKDLRGGH